MINWLLPVSLFIVSAGIALSVYEEWERAGLTDTSLTSLACWFIGLCGIAGWGIFERDSWVFIVAIVPAALFLYWIVLKMRDGSRRRRRTR